MVAFEFGKRTNAVRREPGKRKCILSTYVIGSMSSPNLITIRLGSTNYKASVDTRAEVSVINCRVYRALNPRRINKQKNKFPGSL